MIVVSDTTPIHYLILIGEESVFPAIFIEVTAHPIETKSMNRGRHPE